MNCSYGLRGALNVLDALSYAPGPVVCRVRFGGRIVEDDDQLVASRRTVLGMADATDELRAFACWCVRETPIADGRKVWDLLMDDERSRAAVRIAERYVRGEATNEDLVAALDSAEAAAWDAAKAVTRAAGCPVRTGTYASTAYYAASAVLGSDASFGAKIAARIAAEAAAWASAESAKKVDNKYAAWDITWDTTKSNARIAVRADAKVAAGVAVRNAQSQELERRMLKLLEAN
jgi:hypothetical protein